ncbi:4-hydroxy-tetrahydrodipicolinate synthase [Oricola thermophila]|uniref:4-hydroxy-tetrahydrodipicolinate synthase n=1 Tax=Oricola thermophila TaxID=2742145 RepID=A0A6N1VDN0_9HYPH|nr:4-hydroxy-tetrahydrodipicolinate synthase [Oricola thermophila]QKV18996.1 4-hydroxy-tetrahydrodipicolinate synthase [Oricola thermophila]
MTQPFRGTYTVMITPFTDDGIDVPALREFVNWQIDQGIHGLIPLGSTGEFLSMTESEREQVVETVIDEARGRVPVLIGTGAEWTEDAVRWTRQAEVAGADGVMVIPPFYSTPTEDELFAHYKAVADATSLPVMLYNNPATANVDLTPPIVARLSTIDNVSYIKESTMDVTRIRDILDLCGDRMNVFGGIMGFESFLAGAIGWVAVGSNLMPKEFANLFTATADEKDLEKARAIYRQVLPVIRLVGGHRYVSGSKAGLAVLGHPVGSPRMPRLPLSDDDLTAAREALQQAGAI